MSDEAPLDPVTLYCNDVVAGKIISGSLAIAACERHLADLKDGPSRGLFWRPEKFQRAFDFFPNILTVTAGEKAGKPFTLLPYHVFVLGSLYGWYQADGRRRFTHLWLETGRGQAKGPFMAGVALYEAFFSGIQRYEAYCIGETMVTSNALFADAVAMVRATIPGCEEGDTLESRHILIRGQGQLAWQLERLDTQSKFQALATLGNSLSGPKPRMVLVDEVHEFKDDKAIEQWSSAITKAPGSPLMMFATNTPSANQIVATEYSGYFQRVVKREFTEDSSLAYIARTDLTDDPMSDPTCWLKSLPALGITFPAINVQKEVEKAKRMASKRLSVLRLYFGIPVGSDGFWIDEDAWEAALDDVNEDEMKQYPCFLGLDLSQKNDLTALARVWKGPDRLYANITYWKPKEGLAAAEAEDKAPYSKWVEMEELIATPGLTIGRDFVAAQVAETCAKHNVQMMGFDPAFFADFMQAASDIGFDCYEYHPDKPAGTGLKMMRHAQGARGMHTDKTLWMPRSFQAMVDLLLDKKLTIQESGITTYCASNVKLNSDAQGNQWIEKKRSKAHNDGIVALCMAIGAAMHEPPKQSSFVSIYSDDYLTDDEKKSIRLYEESQKKALKENQGAPA